MTSGTKLVSLLAVVALALGVASWWYRFESAHRSTEFWGPTAAELIARPSQVTAMTLATKPEEGAGAPTESLDVGNERVALVNIHDVTDVPGMVHLRNSMLTDSNFDWTTEVESPNWGWCLLFSNEGQQARLLLSEDFSVVGLLEDSHPRAVNCRPMAETLHKYFASAKLFDASSQSE
ncbi:hypothetical protein [Bythopirellula polymerisocia]|uniref:Uncharacterized protein n=1 Tax=Bythopirellula polymerisocia TaxID=2528003 RepID=A0A5C6CZT0_9BACT|nr:hypothetical protein [Bythopirellula polymerisocia]TWU30100.1 hypothetical protein Pla144_08860 [Bythopirellula polymerisocia]